MLIATWNVNSVRARLPRLVPWLQRHRPDVVLLQETKVQDEAFPREPLEDEGYNLVICGQRTYNGVAILSKHRVEAITKGLPDDTPDGDKRLVGGIVKDLILLNAYVPNGQAPGTTKFAYKLEWLARLRRCLDERYDVREKVLLAGDFNITFDDRDVYDPEALRETIHCSTPERAALASVSAFGLHDALRKFHPEPAIYTWWDHRGAMFQRGKGLRIDHFLLSEKALESCEDVRVDVEERAGKGVSDHAPVLAVMRD
jgi:exodeoxyribonuclease III